MRWILLFALGACGTDASQPKPDASRPIDAKVYDDAHVYMDAKVYEDAHIYMDAPPDAP
ncbi:MAG: hypothetical protein QM831_08245 [Kofleriaceae bacterium]